MPFVVLYDANVLYPSTLRDVLIRVALNGLVQAKWTHQILDETFRNLSANRPDLDPALLARTRSLMNDSIRDVLVTGYEPLIGTLTLPDAGDRHVLAAAIRAKAQVIVTANRADFPADVLAGWDIEARHPDDFLVDQFHLDALTCTGSSTTSPAPGGTRRRLPATCWPAWSETPHVRQPSCGADPAREQTCDQCVTNGPIR